jgi:thiol-disulfide isomerase/thioredoxin
LGAALLVAVAGAAVGDTMIATERWNEWGPLAPSTPVPSFAARGISTPGFEEPADLTADSLRGEISVLMFWTSWCGVCEDTMPTVEALARDYDARGVKVWGVNGDEVAQRGITAAQRKALSFPQVHDTGTASRVFGVSMIPHIVIIDRDATVRHVHQGRVMGSTLRGELDDLLASR